MMVNYPGVDLRLGEVLGRVRLVAVVVVVVVVVVAAVVVVPVCRKDQS
jgi:hypothetical protein